MATGDSAGFITIARKFAQAHSTLALATVSDAGQPQVAPLFYVSDDALNLCWLSSPASRHSINLTARPQAAVTIYPKVWEWMEISGLQIEGSAAAVTDSAQRAAILVRYRDKFALPDAFAETIAASTLYMLRPAWVRWLDNGVGFGYKAEIHLA